jgi:hypothetical protein
MGDARCEIRDGGDGTVVLLEMLCILWCRHVESCFGKQELRARIKNILLIPLIQVGDCGSFTNALHFVVSSCCKLFWKAGAKSQNQEHPLNPFNPGRALRFF